MQPLRFFHALHHPAFAKLYLAQTISLLGDALTWVGLALVAFELAGEGAAGVLAGALTLRVLVFVLLAPIAGTIADRLDRKQIMVTTHLARLGIVCGLPWVTQGWHLYALVLALNGFTAFFTPTYKATIPQVTGKDDYAGAIPLSDATYHLLGVLGPGFAGMVAAGVGVRMVFWLDGCSFLIAAGLILSMPSLQPVRADDAPAIAPEHSRQGFFGKLGADLRLGTVVLFGDASLRYALAVQGVAAIAGAPILVNTVGYVQGSLHLGQGAYGWVMAALGIGATFAAILWGRMQAHGHACRSLASGRGAWRWGCSACRG
jgi:MFS transporter, NRE family, putaive nickel resistance protein